MTVSVGTLHDHLAAGRDNNLNLLRMAAALLVLVSHSFALSTGSGLAEPWRAVYGCTPGTVAVDIFFVISGMLLTHSLLRQRSTMTFVSHRAQRIVPGLVVALALTVFVVGPWLSTLGTRDYFGSAQPYKHFVRNASIVMPMAFDLPGLFEANPWPKAVNGSIWTLRYEVFCYGILLMAWVVAPRSCRVKAFEAACLAIAAITLGMRLPELGRQPLDAGLVHLYQMFFAGSAMAIAARKLKLTHIGGALAASALAVGVAVPTLLPWTYTFALPYLVAYAAYVPAGFIRRYNALGDYSYGTYIYAFPVQQSLAALVPGIGIPAMIAGALSATCALAVASWHAVERPAIQWRRAPVK